MAGRNEEFEIKNNSLPKYRLVSKGRFLRMISIPEIGYFLENQYFTTQLGLETDMFH